VVAEKEVETQEETMLVQVGLGLCHSSRMLTCPSIYRMLLTEEATQTIAVAVVELEQICSRIDINLISLNCSNSSSSIYPHRNIISQALEALDGTKVLKKDVETQEATILVEVGLRVRHSRGMSPCQ